MFFPCCLKNDAIEDPFPPPLVRARTSIPADHDPTDMVLYAYTFASWSELILRADPKCQALPDVQTGEGYQR